ncbi:MAG: NAD(P)(+) transhydrogenase (Re/Si-specific) subunit beta [Nevskiales bacterium]|nr:NAD(P)(+) transhydrogenase (Re/Si-specific) subunit beta [Nevskiales bacterium]
MNFLIQASYFAAAFLFIFGLKRMSSPVTARSGIVWAGAGMVVAVLVSLAFVDTGNPKWQQNLGLIIAALLLGNVWAWWQGRRVPMTAMPQMVALYNGMGGGAAAAIAAIELYSAHAQGYVQQSLALAGALIGSVSFSGSLIAWAKLEGTMQKSVRFSGQKIFNALVLLATVLVGLSLLAWLTDLKVTLFFIGALAFGVLMTIPIGGADMPVVISLYNAFTGMAVGFEGFVLQNPAMIIAGVLVGSAGTLLTLLMARAMNRSLANILFSNFGETDVTGGTVTGTMKPAEASDAAVQMKYASKVIIAPGYGLAVAQAQHKLYEFVKMLQAAGVEVKFAIHPVAGRMPGHMNVLLAEAGVPYDIIHDMEDVNSEFKETDVAVVVGANDTVNPAARTNKSSPIYGMPILNVDQARQVYVIKRGQGKGYSGIENELFFKDNCALVYGDAQQVLVKMIQALKELS